MDLIYVFLFDCLCFVCSKQCVQNTVSGQF